MSISAVMMNPEEVSEWLSLTVFLWTAGIGVHVVQTSQQKKIYEHL